MKIFAKPVHLTILTIGVLLMLLLICQTGRTQGKLPSDSVDQYAFTILDTIQTHSYILKKSTGTRYVTSLIPG